MIPDCPSGMPSLGADGWNCVDGGAFDSPVSSFDDTSIGNIPIPQTATPIAPPITAPITPQQQAAIVTAAVNTTNTTPAIMTTNTDQGLLIIGAAIVVGILLLRD